MMATRTVQIDTLRQWLTGAAAVLRRIVGVPDYERYLAHHRACHPTLPPMDAEEFARDRLEARYSRPGSRCC
jgi:uncharacterized short protein YbdD (DUF466 family)